MGSATTAARSAPANPKTFATEYKEQQEKEVKSM